MTEVPIRDLRNETSVLVQRAQAGEDIVITVRGVPTARLVPIPQGRRTSFPGSEFFARLPSYQADSQMAADLRAMGSEETDVVGPWVDGRQ
jgi:prevent-host-death family protein